MTKSDDRQKKLGEVGRTEKVDLLVIVGVTASGKSALALKVAEEFNGEIIAADSRTVYKGMDIGTAKPTLAEQAKIPHWGLDLRQPGQQFTAHDFKTYAEAKIKEIQSRGRLPILVGGTGLYIDAVLFDFELQPAAPELRTELEAKTTEQLQRIIDKQGYQRPENWHNRRHLIRTIEREGQIGSRQIGLSPGVLVIGLMPPDEELRQQINQRAEQIFTAGVVGETKKLVERYGQPAVAATAGIVYKLCLRFLSGENSRSEVLELFKAADWQYTRRQKIWLRRNPYIKWFSSADEAYQLIKTVVKWS